MNLAINNRRKWGAFARPIFVLLFGACVSLYSLSGASALNHNQNAISGLSKAYGFLLGQEYSLARIAREFPDLRVDVESARLTFGSSFSGVQSRLERELVEAVGDANFKKMKEQITTRIRGLLDQQALTRESATRFLIQVKARAKGEEVEPDVLNYLLAVKYSENPAGEFLAGFRQRFRTDGSGKAQGLKLAVQLPRSWRGQEGERPHIVQKWTSEGGTGLSSILLDVRDAQGYEPTSQEIEQFVQSGEVRQALSDVGTVRDVGTFSLERRKGYWGEIAVNQERAGLKIYQRGMVYQLFIRGKVVGIMCFAGAKEGENRKADLAISRIKPLCQQVLNTLVLEQAY